MIFLAAAAALGFVCHASGNLPARLDSLMNAHYPCSDAPGAAMLVAHNGNVLYEGYRGLADMATKEPISSNTTFNIASVSKQFAAIGALRLHEKGIIDIYDPVSRYFPEFEGAMWRKVRLWQLLSHCSGVPDARDRSNKEFMLHATDRQSMQYFHTLDSLKFEPGTAYDYINPTFQIFFALIEKAGGTSFEAYQSRHVLGPAGMDATAYFDATRAIPHSAHAYVPNEAATTAGTDSDYAKERERADSDYADSQGRRWAECDYGEETFFATKADGGLYSTVRDLLKWELALEDGKIVKNATRDMAYAPRTRVSGSPWCQYQNRPNTWYGYGWFVDTTPGRETKIYHTGDNGGFQAYLAKYPKSRTVVVMLENRNDIDRWSTQLTIERILKEEGLVK